MDVKLMRTFIVCVVLSLSLRSKGVTYCPCPPTWAIVRRRQQETERREREQRELNELNNQRNMVDKNKNQKISLSEAIALCAFASFIACAPFHRFVKWFFEQSENNNKDVLS